MINLHAIYKFRLPNLVPIDGDISYQELAQLVKVDEDRIRRIARYAITKHIFKEVKGQKLAHTATSRMLAQSPMMMEWIGMVCEEMWPAATQVCLSHIYCDQRCMMLIVRRSYQLCANGRTRKSPNTRYVPRYPNRTSAKELTPLTGVCSCS
jgi:hypothetical protein